MSKANDREEGLGQPELLVERLRQLAEADPERVTLALVRYAGWRLTRLRLGSRGLAGGVTAQDLAQEAIRKFLDGERKWNRAVYPTLLDFLKSVVNSLMWNLLASEEHRKVRQVQIDVQGMERVERVGEGDSADTMAREFSTAERSPDQALLERIDEAVAERFWLELEGEIETMADSQIREELLQVFRAVRDARPDYAAIAEWSGIDQDRVYRRFYRLEALAARVAQRLLAELNPMTERCHAD